jgi:S1-C subfamily serine protease
MRSALVALLAALAGGAGRSRARGWRSTTTTAARRGTVVEQAPPQGGGDDGARLDAAQIYKRERPRRRVHRRRVVEPAQTPFDLGRPEQRGQSTGTGFVIDDDGNILTNAHVVENARRVSVSVLRCPHRPGRGPRPRPVLVPRAHQGRPDGLSLRPLTLGTSADVEVGDPTVAIGNPFGLERTLTTGVVSALQRRIDAPDGVFQISDVIQTDAAINPGNSGGPLIDASGKVIGINSAIRTGGAGEGNIGIGFAVPIDTAKRVLPTLKKGKDVERAYLGVSSATVTPEMNLRAERGAVIQDVAPLGPAEDGGLRPGDIIVAIAGEEVRSSEDVSRAVDARSPGDEVEVEVVRAGERERIEVKLGKRPTVGG